MGLKSILTAVLGGQDDGDDLVDAYPERDPDAMAEYAVDGPGHKRS